MATTTKKKTEQVKVDVSNDEIVTKEEKIVKKSIKEEVPVVKEVVKDEPVIKEEPVVKNESKVTEKKLKQFNQNDLVLCRSVTPGWLGVSGKSGQYYIFENYGDYCEIEYQDLFALKSRHSGFIYDPCFVIEDEDLLENPRWTDIAQFYDEKVFTKEDINKILSLPIDRFVNTIKELPKGLGKALQVQVAVKIEEGTFDSINKIKAIDETFGTDFMSIIGK